MHKIIGSLASIIFLLSACGTAVKLAYVDAGGKRGTGLVSTNGTYGDGKFTISDKGQTCKGEFESWSKLIVVFQVKCTDGLSGSVTMARPLEGPVSGEGTMQLSNGETRRFVYNALDRS